MDDVVVTRKQLKDRIGARSASAINRMRDEGRVVPSPDGKGYLLHASLQRLRETQDPAKAHVAERHAKARGGPLNLAPQPGEWDTLPAAPEATRAPTPAPSPADDALAATSPTYADARARRENAEASLREIELRKRQGQILERDDVAAALDLAAEKCGARMDALADVLPPQVVGLDDEARIRAIVAEAVLIIRRELARDFAAMLEVKP